MNKENLVQAVASKTNMPKATSLEAIDAVFAAIEESLIAHEDVSIAGFGKFAAKYKAPRTARNPSTGGMVSIPSRFAVKFSPSIVLKSAVAK